MLMLIFFFIQMYVFLKWINFQCQLTYFVQSHWTCWVCALIFSLVIVVSSALLTSQLEELGFSPLESIFVSNHVRHLAFWPPDNVARDENYPFSIYFWDSWELRTEAFILSTCTKHKCSHNERYLRGTGMCCAGEPSLQRTSAACREERPFAFPST